MKINLVKRENIKKDIDEGLLYDSIKRYIKESKYPKNLVFKKQKLLIKELDSRLDKTIRLVNLGEKQIKTAEQENGILWQKCNSILRELRDNMD